MAYHAALTSLVQLLDDIILHDRYSNLPLSKDISIKSLHEKISSLDELLQNYSSKGDEINDRVEERIRDVAFRAQDAIESETIYQFEKIAQQIPEKTTHGSEEDVEDMEIEEISVQYAEDFHMMEHEIESIMEEVTKIMESQEIEGSVFVNQKSSRDAGALEKAPVRENMMVGFDEYLNTIKEQLIYGQSPQLQVIPIVGPGGIGKTTLARNVFDDPLIVYHFDNYRAWATISQYFDSKKILQGILKSMGMMCGESNYEETLKECIYKHLKGRRYFIVIDDLWSIGVWNAIKRIFPDDYNGSRIVLTTRLLDMAEYAGTTGVIQQMQYLNDEDSWSLFQRKVFAQDRCPPELEAISKSITKQCGGLPLAIVVLAGILSNARTIEEWKAVESNVTLILGKSDEPFSNILSLSYHHLPPQLKVCFLLMGSFPEDYEINISNLMKLWVAEGFLKSSDISESLEDVAEKCLEDLVKRNLVIITKTRLDGQFKTCVLHDLLRDFCRQRAVSERLFHVKDEKGHLYPSRVENVRRHKRYGGYLTKIDPYENLEGVLPSLWPGRTRPFSRELKDIVENNNHKHFKVYEVPEELRCFLPREIFEMFHLRYLAFHASALSSVSPSISMLHNLQSLIIKNEHPGSVEFPSQLWNMTQLRHLIVTRTMTLASLADENPAQNMVCLQTLMTVKDFRFTKHAIDMIFNLRKLKIQCSGGESRDMWELYCLYNLVLLSQLQELKISFHAFPGCPRDFSFPQNLRKLSLEGCQLPWEEMSLVGSLPNLCVLRLRQNSFVGEEWEPLEEEFSCLKFLLLEDLNLKYWQAENFHFPCLEHLKIRQCLDLEVIPLGIGDIPTLKFIDVYESKLAENSATEIQEEQRGLGNDVLQVRIGYI